MAPSHQTIASAKILNVMRINPADWTWNRHNLVQDPDAERQGDTVWHWGEKLTEATQPVLPPEEYENIEQLMKPLVEAGHVKRGRLGWKIVQNG